MLGGVKSGSMGDQCVLCCGLGTTVGILLALIVKVRWNRGYNGTNYRLPILVRQKTMAMTFTSGIQIFETALYGGY